MLSGGVTTAKFKYGDVVQDALDKTNIGVVRGVTADWFPSVNHRNKTEYIRYQVFPATSHSDFLYKGLPYQAITDQETSKLHTVSTYLVAVPNGEEWKRQWAIIRYIKKTRLIQNPHADTEHLNGRVISAAEMDKYIREAGLSPTELASIKFENLYWDHLKPQGRFKAFEIVKAKGRLGILVGLNLVRRVDGSTSSVLAKDISSLSNADLFRIQILYVTNLTTLSPLVTTALAKLDSCALITPLEMEALKASSITTNTVTLVVDTTSLITSPVTWDSGFNVGSLVLVTNTTTGMSLLAEMIKVEQIDTGSDLTVWESLGAGALKAISAYMAPLTTVIYGLFSSHQDTSPSVVLYAAKTLTGDVVMGGTVAGKWQANNDKQVIQFSSFSGGVGQTLMSQFNTLKTVYAITGETSELNTAFAIINKGIVLTSGQLAAIKKPLTDLIAAQLNYINEIKKLVPVTGTGLLAQYEAKLLTGEPLTKAEGETLKSTWEFYAKSVQQLPVVQTHIAEQSVVNPLPTPTTVITPTPITPPVRAPVVVGKPVVPTQSIVPGGVGEIPTSYYYIGAGALLFLLWW